MKLAVYGLGKLGYPLFNVLNHTYPGDVMGVDPAYSGIQVMPDEPGLDLTNMRAGMFSKYPVGVDVSFIVVPTPSMSKGDHRGGFDSAFVETALRHIRNVNKPTFPGEKLQRPIAVIVSTLSPGTCDRLVKQFPNLDIVYNPTFIALGSVVEGLVNPDLLLIGGESAIAKGRVTDIWQEVFDHYGSIGSGLKHGRWLHQAGFTEIELIKLSVNAALGTKISLANSLGQLFEAYGVDPAAVEVVGRDPRIGTAFFKPGGPISGPCLPRDNAALQFAAAQKNVQLPLSHATMRVDHNVRARALLKVLDLNPKTVGILGMTYKYGTGVADGAIGPWLKAQLETHGVTVFAWDPSTDADATETMGADVLVCTSPEYRALTESVAKTGRLVDLWS